MDEPTPERHPSRVARGQIPACPAQVLAPVVLDGSRNSVIGYRPRYKAGLPAAALEGKRRLHILAAAHRPEARYLVEGLASIAAGAEGWRIQPKPVLGRRDDE